MEGVGEQVIAQQDGRLVPPLGVDRRGVAADERLVEDVVVDQRRRVDHLDHRGQDRMGGSIAAAGLAGQEDEGRAEPFPLEVGAVVDQVLDERRTRLPSSAAKIRSASARAGAIGA